MLTVNVKSDLDKAIRKMGMIGSKQMPYAVMRAINTTAFSVKQAETETIKRVFDRPTKFTIDSVYWLPGNKKNLTAKVWLKDFAPKGTPAEKYLQAQIFGGQRNTKRIESLLRRRNILGPNMYVMPGKDMTLDAFGNLPKTHYNKLLAQLKANIDTYQNESIASKKRRTKRKGSTGYFIGRVNGSPEPGAVYMAQSGQVKPVLYFTDNASYTARFKFFDVAQSVIAKNLIRNLEAAWAYANATAK